MDLDFRNAYKILIRKPERRELERPRLKIGVILKLFITN